MAVALVWWRRWPWRRVSSSTAPQLQLGGRGGGAYGEGFSLQPTYGNGSNTTSGATTYTTTTTTGTSNSGSGEGRREFHPFATVVATAQVVEEDAEDRDDVDEEEESAKKKLEHIKSLVVEFNGGNNLSAVERWLRELQVGWVLLLGETAESTAGRILDFYAKSWILALHEIGKSISRCVVDGWRWRSQQQEDQGTSKHHPPAAAAEFAKLVEATVLKMLPFVDIAVATPTQNTHRPGAVAEEKLQALVGLHEALSTASEHILPLLTECTTTRALLSADLTRLGKVIWDTTVEIRNSIIASLDGCDGSMGIIIHGATRSVTSYAKVLWMNHGQLNRIIDDAVRRGEHVCFENENVSYLTNLIIDMVRSLEEQLATNSQSWFSVDLQGLRFLFLINNCYFIFQELQASSQWHLAVRLSMPDLARKIDDYIDCYLQVSWAPVLKCLQAPPATPRCLTAYYSPPLTKFVSRFQKTYAAQKLWKVPDPEMRKRLRKAIVDRVVPVFARFLEDNSIDIDAPGVVTLTPRKVEKMLGELFEG
ncbi:hypothetical protein U9M48_026142 [Paspalum notatum var. saurae]|uniref:Exocyst subunit Exo70 family protein n=1 Tax=Paspalum notatum var. saurae TaxID=547442 RepID=A0AAQ3WY21_PASNO